MVITPVISAIRLCMIVRESSYIHITDSAGAFFSYVSRRAGRRGDVK